MIEMKNSELIYKACSLGLQTKSLNNHCSQACLCGIAPHIGLDDAMALKMMAAMGGGMRHGQLCGAVTAAGVALGLEFGAESLKKNPDETARDKRLGELTEEFVARFKDVLSTTLCDDILESELESFSWDMPEELNFVPNTDNENGNEYNIKHPSCGVAITKAIEIALDIIYRERDLA